MTTLFLRRLPWLLTLCLALPAAPLEPTLGQRGRLLLDESFTGDQLPPGWNKNTGVLTVRDGVLHAGELAAEKHAGAFRKALPLQDAALQLDFQFQGAAAFHVGFDPAPGQLKKKGHLFSVIITEKSWMLTEHNNKADPQSKSVVHARAAAAFPRGQWLTLLLELKGSQVVARVDGRDPLRATAPDFGVKKPGLVFRVGGKDGQEVLIDNVRAWELR